MGAFAAGDPTAWIATEAHVALLEILPVLGHLVEDLVDLLDDQFLPYLMLHALREAFLAHGHGCFGVAWVHFLHDYVGDGVEHLRLSHALSLADYYQNNSFICIPRTTCILTWKSYPSLWQAFNEA